MSRSVLSTSTRTPASRRVASRAGRPGSADTIALRSNEEIDRLREAGAVVRAALDAARVACVVGATTAEIDAAAMRVLVARGASPLFLGYPSAEGGSPFPACTCISVNDEIVHGIPGPRIVRDGDLVSIDCGVMLNGWCSDSAITVPVGRVDVRSLGLLDVAERMLTTAIAMAEPGVRWSDVASAMQTLALNAGHGLVVEYVGHGIGRSLHEAPQVPNCLSAAFVKRNDFTLRPGMVLAIEPMISLHGGGVDDDGYPVGVETRRLNDGWTVVAADGSPSVHVEHTVAITRRGCEVLSVLPVADAARGAEAMSSPEKQIPTRRVVGR